MSDIVPVIDVFFGLSPGSDVFTIEDPVRGELDGDYGLSGPAGTAGGGEPVDIAPHAWAMSISRGRSFELDQFQTGTCVVDLRNYDARFLPDGLDADDIATYGDDAIRPGRRLRVAIDGISVFDGTVEDWDFRYDADGRVNASVLAEDLLARLSRVSFTDWTTTQQLAGARIEASLDRDEVGFGAERDIDDGVSLMQSDSVSWGSNVRNYLELVAESDLGRLFASRSGVVTFRDRSALAGALPTVALGSGRLLDSLTTEDDEVLTTEDDEVLSTVSDTVEEGLPLSAIAVQYGSEVLYTRVQVDREGGTAQTRNDTTAQSDYGVRSLSLGGLLLTTDEESDDMAAFLLDAYSSPRYRFEAVSVVLDALSSVDRASLLTLDLGSVVTVTWRPAGMDASVQQTLAVEGITISLDVDGPAVMSLALAPLLQEQVFIIEDDTYGVLEGPGGLSF